MSTYLVHHGYSQAAEAFNRATGQKAAEETESIRNRQAIRKLVLAGKISDAIELTNKLFPSLLHGNPNLRFMLKVRQFIEVVAGCDSIRSSDLEEVESDEEVMANGEEDKEATLSNNVQNGVGGGLLEKNGQNSNNNDLIVDDDDDSMDVDVAYGRSASATRESTTTMTSILSNPSKFDKLILFGQSLQTMLSNMESANKDASNEENTKILQDAFALLCYTDPSLSPIGWQLQQQERELISDALNSAILESKDMPAHPPLEVAVVHTKKLLELMASNDLGACAFVTVDDYLS